MRIDNIQGKNTQKLYQNQQNLFNQNDKKLKSSEGDQMNISSKGMQIKKLAESLLEEIAESFSEPADELSFSDLLEELPEEKQDKFSDLREELLELIEELNALNEGNRQLLMEALKFNEFSLKTVIGAENNQTYSTGDKSSKKDKSNRIINRQA